MRRGTFLVAMVSVTLIIPSCIAFAGLFKVHAPAYKQEFCRSVDGDTINCGGEMIRLNGIDAPEAMVRAGMTDLSCWQIDLGAAEYVERWDKGHAARDLCMIEGKSDGNSPE